MPSTTQLLHRGARALVASTLLIGVTALPAIARPDPGGGVERPSVIVRADPDQLDRSCSLRRLDRQLVRCDDLTGAGVRAPRSVPLLEPTWTASD